MLTKKVKPFLVAVFLLAGLLVPFFQNPAAHAAEVCPPSTAPAPVICSGIPLGCPGSSLQGPIVSTATLKCQWSPVPNSGWKCPAKACEFSDTGVTVQNGQTYDQAKNGGTPDSQDCTGTSSDKAGCNPTCIDSTGKVIACTSEQYNPGGGCSDASSGSCDLVSKYINPLINFLAALVGVVVVISIVIGGIQYSSSAGDPQAASAAKNRIRNALLALIAFLFLYALLNFLLPGGLLNK